PSIYQKSQCEIVPTPSLSQFGPLKEDWVCHAWPSLPSGLSFRGCHHVSLLAQEDQAVCESRWQASVSQVSTQTLELGAAGGSDPALNHSRWRAGLGGARSGANRESRVNDTGPE